MVTITRFKCPWLTEYKTGCPEALVRTEIDVITGIVCDSYNKTSGTCYKRERQFDKETNRYREGESEYNCKCIDVRGEILNHQNIGVPKNIEKALDERVKKRMKEIVMERLGRRDKATKCKVAEGFQSIK